jgi:hypothetical protein
MTKFLTCYTQRYIKQETFIRNPNHNRHMRDEETEIGSNFQIL